jgi:hypothetical protein
MTYREVSPRRYGATPVSFAELQYITVGQGQKILYVKGASWHLCFIDRHGQQLSEPCPFEK